LKYTLVGFFVYIQALENEVGLGFSVNSHLGNFGLARLLDHEKLEKTTMVTGTLGVWSQRCTTWQSHNIVLGDGERGGETGCGVS
jgi:hypothetical protein